MGKSPQVWTVNLPAPSSDYSAAFECISCIKGSGCLELVKITEWVVCCVKHMFDIMA